MASQPGPSPWVSGRGGAPVTSLCLCTNRWTKRQGRWANHSGHRLVPPPPSGLTAGSAASGSPSRGVGVGGAGRRPPLRAASCAFHKGGNIVAISICFLSRVTSIGGQKCALRAPRCPPSVDAACGRLQLCRARSGALGAGQGSGPGAPPAPGSPGGPRKSPRVSPAGGLRLSGAPPPCPQVPGPPRAPGLAPHGS